MERLLEIGLANAAAAGVLALLVLAVGTVIRRPALLHALWLIVILKLVTPPLATVPVGAPAVRESYTAALELPPATPEAAAVAPPSPRPVDVTPQAGPVPTRQPTAPGRASFAPISAAQALGFVWVLGAAVAILLATVQTIRFARLLWSGRPVPEETAAEALEIARRMGLRRAPRIDLVPGAVSPLLWWVPGRAARIVLPADLWARFDPDSRRTVLAHEIAHFARRDHWVRWLELAASTLYWWHPAVWIARREIRRTEDAACDAWVVWAFPECARKYGAALVETVDFLATARPAALLPGSGIGEARGLKRRLARIVQGTSPRALSRPGWLVVIVAAAAALPFVPGWAEEKPADPASKAPTVLPTPDRKGQKVDIDAGNITTINFVKFLADYSGLPVTVDSTEGFLLEKEISIPKKMADATGPTVVAILQANGFTVERVVLATGEETLVVKPSQRALHERIESLEGKLDRALKDLEALRGRAGTSKDFNYKGKPIGEWIRDLADRDQGTRNEAIKVMYNLQDAVPQLLQAMKSDDVVLRENATLALIATESSEAKVAEAVLRLLKDPEERVRNAAATWNVSWIREDGAAILIEALKNPLPLVRSTAARVLGRARWPYTVAPDGTHQPVPEMAKAVPALAAALEDESPDVRRLAAAALRAYGAEAAPAAPALVKLLGDADAEVALEAAWTLAKVAPDRAPEPLMARLIAGLNPAEGTWTQSARALARLGPAARPAIPRLRAGLEWQDAEPPLPSVRSWAAVALAAMDPRCEVSSADLVVKWLIEGMDYRGDSDLRLAAIDALGALGPLAKSAAPALEAKLKDPYVKRTTAKKTRGAARSATDPEREKAAAALKKIRGE